MIKLIPIYDKDALLNQFHHFVNGLEAVIDNSIGDVSLEVIFNKLMAGKTLLWAVFKGPHVGFVITDIDHRPNCKSFLWIQQGYIKSGTDKDVFHEILDEMAINTKKMGCSALRLQTKREKGFERKLSDKGWQKGY